MQPHTYVYRYRETIENKTRHGMHGTYFLKALRHEKIFIVEAARSAHRQRKRLVLDDQRPRKGTCSSVVTRSTCIICLRLYLPGQLTDGIHRYRQHTHDGIHRCGKTRRDMAHVERQNTLLTAFNRLQVDFRAGSNIAGFL